MGRISQINPETAPAEVKAAIWKHIAEGRKITNEKRTLLHNVNAFNAVSVSNDCLVCTTYFSRLLREEHGIDPKHFHLTHRQEMLMNFGKKVGHAPKEITDEEFFALKDEFLKNGGKDGEPVDEEKAEEIMVVLTAMGVMMVANNYVNDILKVDL